jgi:cytochrome P450
MVNALPPGSGATLLNTIRFAARPLETLRDMKARFGDPFFATTLNGRVVLTGEPELIRELFAVRDSELFDIFAGASMEALFGTQSLLNMAGEPHKRERKLLTPPFHGERMRAYGVVMADATRRAFGELGVGQRFVALERATEVSLETIVRAVFGVDERERVVRFEQAIRDTLDAAKPMFIFSKATQVAPFGLGPWATYLRHSAEADRLLYEQIERVRAHTAGREDILSLMVDARYDDGSAMSDKHIRDELRTLLIAGHETTSIILAWALYEVHRHPEVRSKLRAELDALGPTPSPDALAKLPYLGAVIDETLRLWPVVEVVFRVLRKPWSFGGYELPPGLAIAAAIPLVHRRADLYPNPDAFEPDRFLVRKPKPHEYLPFGGGHRRCIGAAFAHYEACIALATILREFELELDEPREVPLARRNLTLGPKSGVRMRMIGPRR